MSSTIFVTVKGTVTSTTDGEKHTITDKDLCRLYGVTRKLAVPSNYRGLPDEFMVLSPRTDGNYSLQKVLKDRINTAVRVGKYNYINDLNNLPLLSRFVQALKLITCRIE